MSTIYLVYNTDSEPHFRREETEPTGIMGSQRVIKIEGYEEGKPESGTLTLMPIVEDVGVVDKSGTESVVNPVNESGQQNGGRRTKRQKLRQRKSKKAGGNLTVKME